MAFLCPVRIRNTNSGARKKKQADSAGGKKRSFLSATVNSIIGDLHTGSHHENDQIDNNNSVVVSAMASPPNSSQGPGRITGSSSIETLVRVGLEKEAGIPPEGRNFVVLHDFTPCVDDELEVRRGSVVSILYRENDWVYVILEQLPNGVIVEDSGGGREGFIPHSYCAPYGSPLAEMALCNGNSGSGGNNNGRKGNGGKGRAGSNSGGRGGGDRGGGSMSDSETIQQMRGSGPGSGHHGMATNQQQHHQYHGGGGSVGRPHSSFDENSSNNSVTTVPFYKVKSPTRYIALYKFTSRDENDVNVERGEILTVLNKDDPDWFWIAKSDGQEGFVPSAFVYPLTQTQQAAVPAGSGGSSNNSAHQHQPTYQQIDSDHHTYADAQMQQQPPAIPSQHQQLSPSSAGGMIPNNLMFSQHHEFNNNSNSNNSQSAATSPMLPSPTPAATPPQQYGTELVMLYDYKAQAPDDLSVRRGDWVYADLLHQTVEGWLWAFAPKQRKYGFIPKAYARPPAMTSL